ncbi:MAG: PIN domain-containing protein [Xenococcaceae cyanobacterium]
MSEVLCLCLDLNIWCAALLADKKGRTSTSCQTLVTIVRLGYCCLGDVSLVISWGMLNRLRHVLERDLKVNPTTADAYVETIREYAMLAPALTLGGTGVVALRDIEDAHVLETAIAGRANVLVTANFKDFISNTDTQLQIENRHAIYRSPVHQFHIVHPYLMAEWLKLDRLPPL